MFIIYIIHKILTNMWIKYIIKIEVHFVRYLYIMELINARKMERTSYSHVSYILHTSLVFTAPCSALLPSCRQHSR